MTEAQLDITSSVNDVIQLHPASIPVLNVFGVDACCGGAASLDDAARSAGADPAALLEALQRTIDITEAAAP